MTPSKMGKTKNLTFLFLFLVRIVLFLHFMGGIYLSEILIPFFWHHLNNYTPYQVKCFNPRHQNQPGAFAVCVDSIKVQKGCEGSVAQWIEHQTLNT